MSDITPDFPVYANDSGTGQDGTIIDEAFLDAIVDAINNQLLSATNPTLTAQDIIDEVVAARGSKSSLDARLDVSLNEDGSLKTQATLLTQATLQSALGLINSIKNGDLFDWTAGATSDPDNWVKTGAGSSIAKTGIGLGDTTHFGNDSGFAAKITRAGTNVKLTQTVVAGADIAKYAAIKNQKYSVAFKGKTAIASHLRITVDDGVTTTSSSYHTGGNTEEHLSVTHTISASATKLEVYVEVNSSNGDAYVGGIMGVFADLPPTDWQPFSVFREATEARGGLLTASAQAIGGQKIYRLSPKFYPGTDTTDLIRCGGVFWTDTDPVGNVGAGSDTLMTKAMGTSFGNKDRSVIRIRAGGTLANGQTITLSVNTFNRSTTLLNAYAVPAANLRWSVDLLVITGVVASDVVVLTGFLTVRSTAGSATFRQTIEVFDDSGVDMVGGGGTISFVGASTVGPANNDVVQDYLVISFEG